MPELRRDPIVGRWVIISTERGKRPSDFGPTFQPKKSGFCPFCPGNEEKTPPEVYSIRQNGSLPNTPGWDVRVVSNKFPALQIEGELSRKAEGIYDKMSGIGAHEVIIETTEHELDLADLPTAQVATVIRACRERVKDLAKDRRFRYIQLFKNHGEAAGASLEHSHMQLIATPIVPRRTVELLNGFLQHFQLKERCILCDIVDQEMMTGRRVVSENHDFISFEPFAARFPFETWVLPKNHQASFEEMTDEAIDNFALSLQDTLQRINVTLNRPPFNFVLHTSPLNEWKEEHHFHWYVEIMPKLTKVAGFEWGTGFYINPTPPEEAAEHLRAAGAFLIPPSAQNGNAMAAEGESSAHGV